MGWETDKQVTPCGSVLVGLTTYLALGRYYRCGGTEVKMAILLRYQPKAFATTAQRRISFVIFTFYNRDLHGNVLSGRL